VRAAVAPLEEASPWKRPLRGASGLLTSTGRDVDGDRLAAAFGGDGGASRAALRRLHATAAAAAAAAATAAEAAAAAANPIVYICLL